MAEMIVHILTPILGERGWFEHLCHAIYIKLIELSAVYLSSLSVYRSITTLTRTPKSEQTALYQQFTLQVRKLVQNHSEFMNNTQNLGISLRL